MSKLFNEVDSVPKLRKITIHSVEEIENGYLLIWSNEEGRDFRRYFFNTNDLGKFIGRLFLDKS